MSNRPHRELSWECELELAVDSLVLRMRVERVFDRDVDWSMKVQGVDVGRVAREGRREEQLLTLLTG